MFLSAVGLQQFFAVGFQVRPHPAGDQSSQFS